MARLLCLSLVAERARRLRGVLLRSAAPTTCTSRMTGGCCPRVTLHSRGLASRREFGSKMSLYAAPQAAPEVRHNLHSRPHAASSVRISRGRQRSVSVGVDQTDVEPGARRAQTALSRWWCMPVEVQAGDPGRLVRVEDLGDLLAQHVLAHGRDLGPHLPCAAQAHNACSEQPSRHGALPLLCRHAIQLEPSTQQ
jgi:hypothetical protein